MITIIRKELLDHMQSMQFMLLFLLSTALFIACGFFSATEYEQRSRWYDHRSMENDAHPSTISTQLYMRPMPLEFISEGGDGILPPGYTLHQKGFLSPVPERPGNFKLPPLPTLDWSFVIRIVFSLYMILFGFEAIAGEKKQGTLRLTLTGRGGRLSLLAAKHSAILLAVALPLLCGMLVSLIITSVFSPSVLMADLAGPVILTFLLAMVYLSLFAFLSLFVSSLVHQPSLVLLDLLFAWVLFAIIIPGTAGIVSEKLTGVPREYIIAKELEPTIRDQVWANIGRITDRAERGEIKTEDGLTKETDAAFEQGQSRLQEYYASYENAVRQRAETAQMLSRLSPAALFEYASEEIAGTGIHRERRFLEDAHAYSREYDSYALKNTGKLVGTSIWSFGMSVDLWGRMVFIRSPRALEYEGDKSDFPRFVETPRRVGDGIRSALMDIAGLMAWNIVLALLAAGTILRTDVR